MTWAMMLPLIRKFGPWVAVLLVLLGLYWFGRVQGAAKWQARHGEMVAKYNEAFNAAEHAADEVVRLNAAIDTQNDAMRQVEARHSEQMQRVESAHRKAAQNQATVYQRALRDARRDATDLQCSVELMTVAEACEAAWLEVVE